MKQALRAFTNILPDVWDPLGLVASGAPRDEYSTYAPRIFGLLHHGATDLEIANALARIESDQLGLGPVVPVDLLDVAAKIRTAYSALAS